LIKTYLFIEMAGVLTASSTLLTFRLPVSLAFRCWRYTRASQHMVPLHPLSLVSQYTVRMVK